jgi:hypothetical protein
MLKEIKLKLVSTPAAVVSQPTKPKLKVRRGARLLAKFDQCRQRL